MTSISGVSNSNYDYLYSLQKDSASTVSKSPSADALAQKITATSQMRTDAMRQLGYSSDELEKMSDAEQALANSSIKQLVNSEIKSMAKKTAERGSFIDTNV